MPRLTPPPTVTNDGWYIDPPRFTRSLSDVLAETPFPAVEEVEALPSASLRTFGFELEYSAKALDTLRGLYREGITRMDRFHRYHCDCEHCSVVDRGYGQAPLLHAQTDSTADGEFISRVLNDWNELRQITEPLTRIASEVGAQTGPRCGLHVHVGALGSNDIDNLTLCAYLAYERFFIEIVAPGRSQQKRDMNTTLMQALRQFAVDNYSPENAWKDLSRSSLGQTLRAVIARDRHVDLNLSRYRTFEFRSFNATNAAWRIELAARMSVAFVAATPELIALVEKSLRGSKAWPEGCDSPWGEIARPGWSQLVAPHPTKKPTVTMDEFVDCLSAVDPELRPLIERQRSYMRARWAKTIS